MKKVCTALLFVCFTVMGTSQTPFDIEHRLPKSKEKPKTNLRDSTTERQTVIFDTAELDGSDIKSASDNRIK